MHRRALLLTIDVVTGHPVLALGLLLVSGLLLGTLIARIGGPRMLGYVVAGIVFSPDLLGPRVGLVLDGWTDILVTAMLGLIAYLIGGSITVDQMRRVGKLVLAGAAGEVTGAVVVVALGLWGLIVLTGSQADATGFKMAAMLGAIAAATDPAATVAVLHQYRARGVFSQTLLGVVAVDDAFGLIAYTLIATAVLGGGASEAGGPLMALWEILGAVLLGASSAVLAGFAGAKLTQRDLVQVLLIGAILLALGASERVHVSPLLAVMVFGFTLRAIHRRDGEKWFAPIESLEELAIAVLFTLAGAHFLVGELLPLGPIVLAYVACRAAGKMLGAGVSLTAVGAPRRVARWFGMGLVPQGGVAIGLAMAASAAPALESIGHRLVTVVLIATVLNELIGPILTRLALQRVGEIGDKRPRSRP
ncbi:MAG: hypothetical protein GC159_04345 [Phycisphaera sp.]|nr:hypothetical protein [Phycisphaera sp.]